MNNIGIYITDASFDHKTKVASISFLELISKKTGEKHIKCNNVHEAELKGIKECLIHASVRFNNVLVICDSKQAIRAMKRELYENKKWNRKIKDIQLVWLPRTFTSFADFLTKSIKDFKDNKNLKVDSFLDDSKRMNIMDIYVTKKDEEDIIIEQINYLKDKYNFNIDYKSKVLKEIFLDSKIKNIENEDKKIIKEDIKNIIRENPSLLLEREKLDQVVTMLFFF